MRRLARLRKGNSGSVLQILFWVCAAIIVYVYAGYPLALASGLIARRTPFPVTSGVALSLPSLSIIIAAHNEESAIESKIQNIFASEYPRELLEILVGSDGSSDRTEQIVRKYAGAGVGLISFPQQQGKSAIQNGLVAAASGELLVFTDADCELGPHSLRSVARRFDDPRIGLVTGALSYLNETENSVTQNEGAYLRYESWLRRQESDRGLLAMASGSLFAMRHSLWRPLDRSLGDDFELPLRVALKGLRTVLEPDAQTLTRLSQNSHESIFALKVRIISKDFRALRNYKSILNPFRHTGVAVALWSHKLLRWLVPYFLLGMLFSSLFLLNFRFYCFVFALEIIFYAIAVLGWVFAGPRIRFPWSIATSFCIVNLAAFFGTLKSFVGRSSGSWIPLRS
jgi:cellulose synthase/poly-beta-1,6-N-acetylglucosamine synthase-like glycosyltransferase